MPSIDNSLAAEIASHGASNVQPFELPIQDIAAGTFSTALGQTDVGIAVLSLEPVYIDVGLTDSDLPEHIAAL